MDGEDDGAPHSYSFGYGDLVRHRLSREVVGIVVDSFDFGSKYAVKISAWEEEIFAGVELEYVLDDDDPPAKSAPLAGDKVPGYDNVVYLNANSKTKGAA